MRYSGIPVILTCLLLGCSGDGVDVQPVSGTVTLDGKPLADVVVQFNPVGSRDNPNPGRTSYGRTDAQGRFEMKYDGTDRRGAVVGGHRVSIHSEADDTVKVDPETGSPDGQPAPKVTERVPRKYNQNSQLTFDVPAGGTSQADFKLTR